MSSAATAMSALHRALASHAPQPTPAVTVRMPTAGQYDSLLPSFQVMP